MLDTCVTPVTCRYLPLQVSPEPEDPEERMLNTCPDENRSDEELPPIKTSRGKLPI